MHAKNLVLNHRCEGNIIEQVGEHRPHIFAPEFLDTLVIKPIYLRYSSRLVVSSSEGDSFRVSNLQTDQQCYSFYRVVAPINIVTKEEVVGEGYFAADCEEFDEVMELAMYIATDGDRSPDRLGVGFIDEYFHGLIADELDFALGDGFELLQGFYDCVDIMILCIHSNFL